MAQDVIVMDHVNKSLSGRPILQDITFAVQRGDIFGYLGPNGAGKTTTIRVLLGLYSPDSGEVRVLGNSATNEEANQKVGFMLEADGLYDTMTAHENLNFYGEIYSLPANSRLNRIDQMLGLVGLSDRAKDKVSTFSKGMRQRLALARAMLHDPELLVLDEPTAGLDPSGQIEIRELILDLAQRGKTIFLSSHNLDEVQRICNRIALIDRGSIKLYGELEQLRMASGRKEVVVKTSATPDLLETAISELQGLPDIESCDHENGILRITMEAGVDTTEIVARLLAHGIGIEELKRGEATLEEIYARVVREEKE